MALRQATERMTLDVSRLEVQTSLAVTQGDTMRRWEIKLTDRGQPIEIGKRWTAALSGIKPDGKVLYNGCTVASGRIVYDFASGTEIATAAGAYEITLEVYDVTGGILHAPRIWLNVLKNRNRDIASEDQFTAAQEIARQLASANEKLDQVDEQIDIATQAAGEAEESAKKAAEEATKATTEAGRTAAEATEAATAEVTRLVGELGVVQNMGNSPTAVMSQKETTDGFVRYAGAINLYNYDLGLAGIENGKLVTWDKRVSTSGFIPVGDTEEIILYTDNGYAYGGVWYAEASEESFIGDITSWGTEPKRFAVPPSAKYMRFVAKAIDGSIFKNTAYMPIHVKRIESEKEKQTFATKDMGNYSWDNGKRIDTTRRLGPKIPVRNVKKGEIISVKANGLYTHLVVYEDIDAASPKILYDEGWVGTDRTFVIPCDGDLTYAIANGANYTLSTDIKVSDYTCEIVYLYGVMASIIGTVAGIKGSYAYTGEKIPSKMHYFGGETLLRMSYDGGVMTSQDIEVHGDYMFIGFSGTEKILVYSLATKALVAEMPVTTYHAGGMQFSGEYYASGDPFPLLYAGGEWSNKISVIRIQNSGGVWSATEVRTLYIPTEQGHGVCPSIDAKNNIMYGYAFGVESYYAPNNYMVLTKWDLNRLTENADGTYTPALLSECECPYVGVTQGRKYLQGRIYLGVASTGSPHNAKFIALDAGTGDVVTTIDMTKVTTSEAEGLAYRVNGDDIEWYYSDYFNVYKLTF